MKATKPEMSFVFEQGFAMMCPAADKILFPLAAASWLDLTDDLELARYRHVDAEHERMKHAPFPRLWNWEFPFSDQI